MNRLEAKFGSRFGRWVHYKWDGPTFHFELKVARNGSLPFRAISDKQKTNLRIARKKFYHKFSDIARLGTPFDGTFTRDAESYVVIQFDKPQNKEFFMCPIEEILIEEDRSERKSLTEERCRDLFPAYLLA